MIELITLLEVTVLVEMHKLNRGTVRSAYILLKPKNIDKLERSI